MKLDKPVIFNNNLNEYWQIEFKDPKEKYKEETTKTTIDYIKYKKGAKHIIKKLIEKNCYNIILQKVKSKFAFTSDKGNWYSLEVLKEEVIN